MTAKLGRRSRLPLQCFVVGKGGGVLSLFSCLHSVWTMVLIYEETFKLHSHMAFNLAIPGDRYAFPLVICLPNSHSSFKSLLHFHLLNEIYLDLLIKTTNCLFIPKTHNTPNPDWVFLLPKELITFEYTMLFTYFYVYCYFMNPPIKVYAT